ncbi:hypothetical protein CsSME_00018444 [Camellia sinensis var. sinensis]
MSRTRFGFVRYDCLVAATMALQKTDGMWCDDKALKVKMAQFGKEEAVKHNSAHPNVGRDDRGKSITVPGSHRRNMSYAQALREGGSKSKSTITVRALEEGNGWLYESVIVRLKSSCSVTDFQKELLIRDLGVVKFTIGGGRDVILSFNSVKMMQQEMMKMEGWIKDWTDSVKVWKQGMILDQERIVWLSCYGVPPNLWSFNTFNSIGRQWGQVIELDDNTLQLKNLQCGKVRIATSCMESINASIILDCKGVFYPVKICEEQIVISKVVMQHCSCRSIQSGRDSQSSNNEAIDEVSDSDLGNFPMVQGVDEAAKKGVDDHRVAAAAGERTVSEDDGKVNSGQSVSVVEETISRLEVACGVRNVSLEVKLVGSMQGVSGDHAKVNDVVCTPGFIRSLSGSVCQGAGLNLEVVLGKAQAQHGGNNSNQAQSLGVTRCLQSPTNGDNYFQPICRVSAQHQLQIESASGVGLGKAGVCSGPSHQVTKTHRKQKSKCMRRRVWNKKGGLELHNRIGPSVQVKKGAILRSAVAAISLSMASESSRGRLLLNEAEANLQMGRVLGLNCEGKEEEVMSKLMELESRDMDKVHQKGKGVVS